MRELGQVDMSFAPVANMVPLARTEKLRLLGPTGAKRSAFAPDTPTISETHRAREVEKWGNLVRAIGVKVE